ncbi:MAG TPA: RNA polymerase sigma factor [Candidatus Acidoferrum sp.]|jgi:RNA polymerase sigma-70 factor (ECF subfamily)
MPTISTAEAATAKDENFDRILREYGPALSRLAASYEPVITQREDLLQEIALALWRALPRFRGECSERTFIYRIAHNQGLSHAWRRHSVQQPLEEIAESQEPVDPRPQPEEQAAQQHQRIRLVAAIQSLPVAYRQIVTLVLEDLSHAEIADVLGISENNVAVRLNRARKALKEALGVA